jgi:hypothetical protein
MTRAMTMVLVAVVAILAEPSTAHATDGAQGAAMAFRVGAGLLGLAVAIVLLLEAVRVRRLAQGGAIAERIGYVVLATLCLSAAALGQWVQNFVAPALQGHVQLAAELLVITAMGLLAAYFYNVRSALQTYLSSATDSELRESDASESGEA